MDMEKILGFNWNSEEEWNAYLEEVKELFASLDKYMRNTACLKSLSGVDITYGSEKTDAFFNIQTVREWREFMWKIYGIRTAKVIDRNGNDYQESTRIMWSGGYDLEYEYESDFSCALEFYCVIRRVYDILTAAGFKSQQKRGDFPKQEDLLSDAEELIRKMVSLSPLLNSKAFFLLSLRYIPKKYAEMMYKELNGVENLMGWKRHTSWKNIDEKWQICSYTNAVWSRVAEAMHLLYGFNPEAKWWNSSTSLWKIIGSYIGENIHNKYLKYAKNEILHVYASDPNLSEFVSNTLEDDFLFAEVNIKSLSDMKFTYFVVEDIISSVDVPFKGENLIKFIAPQMFLNLSTMYIDDAMNWTVGFYLPKPMIEKKIPDDLNIDDLNVSPLIMDADAIIPHDWKMHTLRNILNTIGANLEYLPMEMPEYEDFGGNEE